jgi:hypothetical protein
MAHQFPLERPAGAATDEGRHEHHGWFAREVMVVRVLSIGVTDGEALHVGPQDQRCEGFPTGAQASRPRDELLRWWSLTPAQDPHILASDALLRVGAWDFTS